jgi:Secretion system C-terminal sorting domain
MMKKIYQYIALLLFIAANSYSQAYKTDFNNHWIFGNNDINWSTNPPTITSFNLSTLPNPGSTDYNASNGVVSDENGNLLFYTNGVKIWDKNHAVMTGGSQISGSDITSNASIINNQKVTIIPDPTTKRYKIIVTGKNTGSSNYNSYYTDISFQNNPLGEIVTGGGAIASSTSAFKGGMAITKSNQEDGYWILKVIGAGSFSLNKVYTKFIKEPTTSTHFWQNYQNINGQYQPNFYMIDPSYTGANRTYEVCKFSSDNTKIGFLGKDSSTGLNIFVTANFDGSTGFATAITTFPVPSNFTANNFEFSADSQKVYFCGNDSARKIFIIDIANPATAPRVLLSNTNVSYSLITRSKYGEILISARGTGQIYRILNENSFSNSILDDEYINLLGTNTFAGIQDLPAFIPSLGGSCSSSDLILGADGIGGIRQASNSITSTANRLSSSSLIYRPLAFTYDAAVPTAQQIQRTVYKAGSTIVLKDGFTTNIGNRSYSNSTDPTNTATPLSVGSLPTEFLAYIETCSTIYKARGSNDDVEAFFSEDEFASPENVKAVTIYPNPISTQFTVSSKNKIKNMTVNSFDGKVVFSKALNGASQYEIDSSTFASGLYLIAIEDINGKITLEKVIKN